MSEGSQTATQRSMQDRAAALRDEILFKQFESSHLGDCPICCLPLSIYPRTCTSMACCSKRICNGCYHSNMIHELKGSLERKCPFCRHPDPETQTQEEAHDEEAETMRMKRTEANDPTAMCDMGRSCYHEGDYKSAFGYVTKAAGLGDMSAHHQLSVMYLEGKGVEKDEKKLRHHLEQAAIGGHPDARYNLGIMEKEIERYERAIKHWIIAANLGHDGSLNVLKKAFMNGCGLISKDDFAAALRAHQAAVDAMKSSQRDEAEPYMQKLDAAKEAQQD